MEHKKIKLYLLAGFLGAGKTTFLKKLIDKLSDKKVGIIMNEFGKISIDGLLIKKNGIDILEINNGSIFCSCLKEPFIEGLITYSELPIDYLLVESSGMADPSSVKHLLNSVIGKMKGKSYDFRGTICIVDAVHFLEQVELLVAIRKQIAAGSLIIINKIDLCDEENLRSVEQTIREINPTAELHRTSYCDIDFNFLDRDFTDSNTIEIEESCNTPFNRPVAYTLSSNDPLDKDKLEDFIKSLAPSTLRIKGFFRLKEGWHQIDAVKEQIEIIPTAIEQDTSKLVIIAGSGLLSLQEIFNQWDKRFCEHMELV